MKFKSYLLFTTVVLLCLILSHTCLGYLRPEHEQQQLTDQLNTDTSMLSKLSPNCRSYTMKIVTEREFFADLEKERLIDKPAVDTLVKEHIELIKSYCVEPTEQSSVSELYHKRVPVDTVEEGTAELPSLLTQWMTALKSSGIKMAGNAKKAWHFIFDLPSNIGSALFHRLFSEDWIDRYAARLPPGEREEWKRRARAVAERRFERSRGSDKNITPFYQRIWTLLTGAKDKAKDAVTSPIFNFFNSFSSGINYTIDKTADVIKGAAHNTRDFVEDIKENIGDAVDVTKDRISDVKEAVTEKFGDAYDNLKGGIRDIRRDMEYNKRELKREAEGAYDKAKQKAHEAKENIKETAKESMDKAREKVEDWKRPVEEKFNDWRDQAEAVLEPTFDTYEHGKFTYSPDIDIGRVEDLYEDTLRDERIVRSHWFSDSLKRGYSTTADFLKRAFVIKERPIQTRSPPIPIRSDVEDKREWRTLDILLMTMVLPFLLLLPLLLGRQALFGSKAKLAKETTGYLVTEVDQEALESEVLATRLEAKMDRGRNEMFRLNEELKMDLNALQEELLLVRRNTMGLEEMRGELGMMKRTVGEACGIIHKDFSTGVSQDRARKIVYTEEFSKVSSS